MNINIDELIKIINGYGTDSQPLTIGILKAILNELQSKQN